MASAFRFFFKKGQGIFASLVIIFHFVPTTVSSTPNQEGGSNIDLGCSGIIFMSSLSSISFIAWVRYKDKSPLGFVHIECCSL